MSDAPILSELAINAGGFSILAWFSLFSGVNSGDAATRFTLNYFGFQVERRFLGAAIPGRTPINPAHPTELCRTGRPNGPF
jgi:hypothetical protein